MTTSFTLVTKPQVLARQCLFFRQDGSSKRLGRNEVNVTKRETCHITLTVALTLILTLT